MEPLSSTEGTGRGRDFRTPVTSAAGFSPVPAPKPGRYSAVASVSFSPMVPGGSASLNNGTWLGTVRSSRDSTRKRVGRGRGWRRGFRMQRGRRNVMVDPSRYSKRGLRENEKALAPGAQTERRGGAGPAGGLLTWR